MKMPEEQSMEHERFETSQGEQGERRPPWRWILVGHGRVLAVAIPLVILALSPIMRDWMLLLLLPSLMLVMLASILRAWQWRRSRRNSETQDRGYT